MCITETTEIRAVPSFHFSAQLLQCTVQLGIPIILSLNENFSNMFLDNIFLPLLVFPINVYTSVLRQHNFCIFFKFKGIFALIESNSPRKENGSNRKIGYSII